MAVQPDIRRVLITGATGFIGPHVCAALKRAGWVVRGAKLADRQPLQSCAVDEWVAVADIGGDVNWSEALRGVNTIVHLAGRVHVMHEHVADPLAEYRRFNVAGTESLARSAAFLGVSRVVFVSSIKVNGERTGRDRDGAFERYHENTPPSPHDAYAISKWEAECRLQDIAAATGIEVVIVRPPLVYGPGVGANFLRLMRLVDRGIPLPFGSVHNLRSLIYVENLADALTTCVIAPQSRNRTYLIRDVDLSTADLIRTIASALGRRPRLLNLPDWVVRLGAHLCFKDGALDRLTGSLLVDDHLIRRELSWVPKCSLESAMARTAAWYRSRVGQAAEQGAAPS